MDEAPTGQLDYGNSPGMQTGSTILGTEQAGKSDDTPQSTGSSMPDENQQEINKQESAENQQLAEAGDFDQLLSSVNANMAEMGLEEDSKEMIGALTEIANAGSPEYRVWAGKMLNWHNEMANFMKGVQ